MLMYIAVHLQYLTKEGGVMSASKSTTLTLRIDPGVKEALRIAAEQEHRSITNMVEVLIRDYCGHNGVEIPSQGQHQRDKKK